jgi:thioredoxin reductase (NADPH)
MRSMKNPYILTVDDDTDVLRAISHDVRRHFGKSFRVLPADSGQSALEATREAKLSNDTIALFLADQRMPGMSGVEFLEQARTFFPEAKSALLTAYADTDAAIKAINDVRLDYYLMKPWDPPEERLYPVLDDLIEDWMSSFRPAFEGIHLIGHRWSAESHELRDFLARNQVPFRWLEVTVDPEAQTFLAASSVSPDKLPTVVMENGAVLSRPTIQQLAEQIGLRHAAESPVYDLIIIGAGPAGLAAAVGAASEGLRTCMLERYSAGGQAGMSSRIENYLGFPQGLSGDELARRASAQAKKFGAENLLTHEASRLTSTPGSVGVQMADGSEIRGHSMIIATGVAYRRLSAPGVEQLTGRGVYYGAARTEAAGLKGDHVYVVGGANSAGQAAVYFAETGAAVTMMVRGESLSSSMSSYLIERIDQAPNIDVRYHSGVAECIGEDRLEQIVIENYQTGERETVDTPALFIFIGATPPTDWLRDQLLLDDKGFIVTGMDVLAMGKERWPLERDPFLLETSSPGIFAAGDVRRGSGKRVAAAVGEGTMAVMSIWQYRTFAGL